jgi:hypothetical protein
LQGGDNVEPTKSSAIFGVGISVVCFFTFGTSSGPSHGASEGRSGKV